jgi:hypothetical protein
VYNSVQIKIDDGLQWQAYVDDEFGEYVSTPQTLPPGFVTFNIENEETQPLDFYLIEAASIDDLPVVLVLDPFEGTFSPELDESALGSQLIGKHEVPAATEERYELRPRYELDTGTYLVFFGPEECLTLMVAEPSPQK